MILASFCRISNGLSDEINMLWRCSSPLSEDLESYPFLNSALQRFTCEMYHRFGPFLAFLSVGLITSRHYLSERNKNGGTSGTSAAGGDERTAE